MEALDETPARLVIVTGKGGVGKSSVAAALAVAGALGGQRTCLVEVEGKQSLSVLLGGAAWGFSEREVRANLFGLSIDADSSLFEYLKRFYGAHRLSRLVVSSSAVNFATAAAPGVRDVLLLGKVKEVERRGVAEGHPAYDLVVVDAPPTGRIVNFLKAPEATTALVGVGPVRSQAQSVVDMLLDSSRTRVQLVTAYEELAVSETVESAAALLELGMRLSPVLVNRVIGERLDEAARKALSEDLRPPQLRRVLSSAGVRVSAAAASQLRLLGEHQLQRLESQQRMREALARGLPPALQQLPGGGVIELPALTSSTFGAAEVTQLAEAIRRRPR